MRQPDFGGGGGRGGYDDIDAISLATEDSRPPPRDRPTRSAYACRREDDKGGAGPSRIAHRERTPAAAPRGRPHASQSFGPRKHLHTGAYGSEDDVVVEDEEAEGVPGLSAEEVDRVIGALHKALISAVRVRRRGL